MAVPYQRGPFGERWLGHPSDCRAGSLSSAACERCGPGRSATVGSRCSPLRSRPGRWATRSPRLALPLLVLDLTHDIGSAATLRVIQTVPYVLFGAFAGALIDRSEKRRLLRATTVASILLTITIPIIAITGAFSLGLVYAAAFLLGTAEVVWGITADFSIVPALVEPRELTSANSIYLTADRLARSFGPSLGGFAVAVMTFGGATGSTNALWIAGLLYLPTLVVFARMPPLHDVDLSALPPLTVANVRTEVTEGFGFLWRSEMLRALLVLMFVSNLGAQGLQTLLLFVLREEYRLDAVTIGLALSFTGVIQIFGSALAPRLARGRPLGQTMVAVVTFAAISSGIATFARTWQVVLLAYTGRQAAWSAHIVYALLPRQHEVPATLRGRVNGAFRTLILISNTSSPALLSAIAAVRGTSTAFAAAALLGLASVGVSLFGPLRRYDLRDAPAEAERVEPEAEEEAAGAN